MGGRRRHEPWVRWDDWVYFRCHLGNWLAVLAALLLGLWIATVGIDPAAGFLTAFFHRPLAASLGVVTLLVWLAPLLGRLPRARQRAPWAADGGM